MTTFDTLVEQTRDMTWTTPTVGVWAASRGGKPRGLVERTENGYVAFTARGRTLGTFDDLVDACIAVEGFRPRWRRPDETLLSTVSLAGLTAALTVTAALLIARF